MRIGVLEWASCGGAVGLGELPESIRHEGWAMCRAIIESLHLGGHQTVACLVPDLPSRTGFHARPNFADNAVTTVHRLATLVTNSPRDVREQWRREYADCDATIVIAPESDGILLELEAWCRSVGMRTCSSDAVFIEQAGDKWLTAERLSEHQVPHPETQLLSQWIGNHAHANQTNTWVLKARDGVGCEGMQRVVAADLERIQASGLAGERWIVQPWLGGQPYSRTAIVDAAGQCYWLPVVRQHLSIGQIVRYEGGRVLPDLALTIAQTDTLHQAILALPGQARGWVGVDFLIDDHGRLTVIEINPRLTTSFVGLFQACDCSLADVLVRAALGMEFKLPSVWEEKDFQAI